MGKPLLKSAIESSLSEVGDGVWAYVQHPGGWCVSNSGFISGGNGGAVIDTLSTERRTRDMRRAYEGAGLGRPEFIVNTHHHGDHHFGNFVYGEEVTIVGHQRTREEIIGADKGMCSLWPDVEWGDIKIRPPQVTYQDSMQLGLGGERVVELLHYGPGHTSNDTLVWLPQEGILFCGDVAFPSSAPYLLMGSALGSISVLEKILVLDPKLVIPGHGAWGGIQMIHDTLEYLEWIVDTARVGIDSGTTPAALAAEVRNDRRFVHLGESERLITNLEVATAELLGVRRTAEDLQVSFSTMCLFHGGRPESLA